MQIDPRIQALCGNPSAQRRAQARVEAAREGWLTSAPVTAALAELSAYGSGESFDEDGCLAAALSSLDKARNLVEPLVAAMAVALREEPLAHVPFRHQKNGGTSIMQLANRGRAALVLLTYDESCGQASETATFSDVERREIVLGGAADLLVARVVREWPDRAAMDLQPRRIEAGDALALTSLQARLQQRVHGRMTVLRVARTPVSPGASRVFRLDDGRLVHRASGERRESQREMAMALLGRMGRADAAPALARQARAGSEHIRWQALRECLALDTAIGFTELVRMAGDPADPLASAAQALHAQLIETYPQLAAKEAELCRA